MNRTVITAGDSFGRLSVLQALDRSHGESYWLCQCECGKESRVSGAHLRTGHTRSCGCLGRENRKNSRLQSEKATTHGMSETKEYKAWASMLQRCLNPSNIDYENYGGRGIEVFSEWKQFEIFIRDVGLAPTVRHTLDRINNSLGYEPGNVRWATYTEQNRNRRDNVSIEFRGQKRNVSELAIAYGIEPTVLHRRLKLGWDIERAISQPLRQVRRTKNRKSTIKTEK